jgi:hypothetical protein
VATGPKTETTVAYTTPDQGPLLGPSFLTKWRRSGARWPAEVAEAEQPAFEAALLAHPQWALPPGESGSG